MSRRFFFKNVKRSNRIVGRGVKSIYKFAPRCKTHLKYVGSFLSTWHYGAGKYDNTYKLRNVLGLSEKPESDNLFEFLCDQYRKFIVNRIVLKIYNVTMTQRSVVGIKNGDFSWTDTSKYPLDELNYEVDYDSGRHGNYCVVFRSFSDEDASLSLHTSHSDNSIRIGLTDGGMYKKKTHTFYYYPRCTKAITSGIANMPGHDTWVNILTKMGVKSPIFQFSLGYGPFVGQPLANSKGIATETDLQCEFTMSYDMTFSDRKPANLINVTLPEKVNLVL